jgi:hypothetical protein
LPLAVSGASLIGTIIVRLDKVGLDEATCEWWMGADGTVYENVVKGINTTECDISPEALEKWIDSIPIAPYKPGWQILTLPSSPPAT